MPSEVHNTLIDGIQDDFPEAQRYGFWKAIDAISDLDYVAWLRAECPDWKRVSRFIPDAYIIDEANRAVVAFEAIVHNDITPNKMGRICDFAFALDEDGWEMILICVTIYGSTVKSPMQIYMERHLDAMAAA